MALCTNRPYLSETRTNNILFFASVVQGQFSVSKDIAVMVVTDDGHNHQFDGTDIRGYKSTALGLEITFTSRTTRRNLDSLHVDSDDKSDWEIYDLTLGRKKRSRSQVPSYEPIHNKITSLVSYRRI